MYEDGVVIQLFGGINATLVNDFWHKCSVLYTVVFLYCILCPEK